jgi:hypothetical protein
VRVRRNEVLLLGLLAFGTGVAAQDGLTDVQVVDAIALGRAGKVPTVHVSTFLGDYDVFIQGPVARIAQAAARAFREYRPFELADVPPEMKAPTYRIIIERKRYASSPPATHIVLQPRRAKGMDGVIQPLKERVLLGDGTAEFDRLPDGEFDVVVVTADGPEKYAVSLRARDQIQ